MKILLILLKFHEKTVTRSGDMKIVCPVRRMYMHNLSPSPSPSLPFMDEVLSVERQLMKWVGILQVEVFWVGIFLVGIFQWGV